MDLSSATQVLVVAHRTAATPQLLDAVRARAALGPARFFLLVTDPAPDTWPPTQAVGVTEAERVLTRALPLIAEAADGPAHGSCSLRTDAMDAIEDALRRYDFDEIILSTLAHGVSRRLHVDLPRRVAHLGLPVTSVVAGEHADTART